MTATRDLTDRQRQILRHLVLAYAEHGRPASIREVMRAAGVTSPNGAVCHLDALIKKGYLRYAGRAADAAAVTSRGLVVVGLDERIRAAAREYLADLGE